MDTISPFVLRDLGINLRRLRRTKKNASPHVTRARSPASVWIDQPVAPVWVRVEVPPGVSTFLFVFFFILPPLWTRGGTPNTPVRPPPELSSGALVRRRSSDVPSINHNIRINIPRTSFAPLSAPPLSTRHDGWTRPTHRRCKNFPTERGWRFAPSKQTEGRGGRRRGRGRGRTEENRIGAAIRRANRSIPETCYYRPFPFCGRERMKLLKQAAPARIFHPVDVAPR